MNERDFMNVKEAAEYLRISKDKLYQLKANTKDFPYHKVDEKLIFYREELKAWVLAH
jgi:excisionase family DNA binding protein